MELLGANDLKTTVAAFAANSCKCVCRSTGNLELIPLHARTTQPRFELSKEWIGSHWFENDERLWARSFLADAWLPLRIQRRERSIIERFLQDGDSNELSPRLYAFLYYAGVCAPTHRNQENDRLAKKQFADCGYASLGQLFPPAHIAALRELYRALLGANLMQDDTSTPGRKFSHTDAVSRFYHRALTRLVASFVGHDIEPSYVLAGTYAQGSRLNMHTDRCQCEYTVSMHVDFDPEPSGACPWPLCIRAGDSDVEVFQELGDALLFRGTELAHYRTELRNGENSTSVFFHYVRTDFKGELD